jgi:hypothetical protein
MHENRETSLPTARASSSPAGKGESRTSGTHGSEESDRAVVPMKPSNKATGQTPEAAERVEGRVRTKENVPKARAAPAQDGTSASQGLKGVRQAAREREQERFTTWLHHLTVELLRDSYYALKREAAPGGEGAAGLRSACAGECVRGEPGRGTGGEDVGADPTSRSSRDWDRDWDRVHVFEMCEACSKKTRVLGTAEAVEEHEFYVI